MGSAWALENIKMSKVSPDFGIMTLAKSPSVRKELGRKCRQFVEDYFNRSSFINNMLYKYEELCSK